MNRLSKKISFVLRLFLLLLLLQTGSEARSQSVLRIESNLVDGAVYVDSLYSGTVEKGTWKLEAGTYRITLVPVSLDSWQLPPVHREVELTPGDTTVLSVFLPRKIRVDSVPFDADVFWKSDTGTVTRVGRTPLTFERVHGESGEILIERQGYESETVVPSEKVYQVVSVLLTPNDELASQRAHVFVETPRSRKSWINYLAGAATLSGGIYAIVNKFKADDIYEDYTETGDPNLRPEFRRYDVRSAIGLGVMQGGIGVLAVRFFLR